MFKRQFSALQPFHWLQLDFFMHAPQTFVRAAGRLMPVAMLLVLVAGVGACARSHNPLNTGALFDPEKAKAARDSSDIVMRQRRSYEQTSCPPAGTQHYIQTSGSHRKPAALKQMTMRYSPGDRFSETYVAGWKRGVTQA